MFLQTSENMAKATAIRHAKTTKRGGKKVFARTDFQRRYGPRQGSYAFGAVLGVVHRRGHVRAARPGRRGGAVRGGTVRRR